MKSSTIMIILTAIIIAVASFGKYVDGKIHASATTILEDRLKPGPLLSHRFDYYGTYIEGAFTTNINNIDTVLAHKSDILKSREETEKDWKAYLATYLVPEEDSVAHLADKEMIEVDKKLDAIFDLAQTDKAGAQKLLDQSNIKQTLPSITDKVNWLTDLQTRVGQEETVKMLSLIATFDNFMIGSLALAVMLAGSIVYSAIRDRKDKQPVKKATKKAVKKPAAKKKPIKKTTKKK
jgi:Four helix bundle sensory module for signal transduction